MHASLIRPGMTLGGVKILSTPTVTREGKPRIKVNLADGRYRLVKPDGSLPVDGYANGIPAGGLCKSRHVKAPAVVRASDTKRLPRLDRWGRTVANCRAYDK